MENSHELPINHELQARFCSLKVFPNIWYSKDVIETSRTSGMNFRVIAQLNKGTGSSLLEIGEDSPLKGHVVGAPGIDMPDL
jgi:hypothetical protein